MKPLPLRLNSNVSERLNDAHRDSVLYALDCLGRLNATNADVVFGLTHSIDVAVRLGERELTERAEVTGLGLRPIIDGKQALVSTSDLSRPAIFEAAERAVAMARALPADDHCFLADHSADIESLQLDLSDVEEPLESLLWQAVIEAEAGVLAEGGKISSDGAEISWSSSAGILATSKGFFGEFHRTKVGLGASAIATDGAMQERDYDVASDTHFNTLPSPYEIGKAAGQRAVRRLGARRIATIEAPIVFERRAASSLLAAFLGSINGASVASGRSFLKTKMGTSIFPAGVSIVDDAHQPRRLGSCAFDGEGICLGKVHLVENGILKNWLLDARTASRLGLPTNGRATRSVSTLPAPSPTNAMLLGTSVSLASLLKQVHQGLYVTHVLGTGANIVTGDYSVGVAGHWIDNGEVSYPVSEITIAGHLNAMLKEMVLADDAKWYGSIYCPSIALSSMMIGGTCG